MHTGASVPPAGDREFETLCLPGYFEISTSFLLTTGKISGTLTYTG